LIVNSSIEMVGHSKQKVGSVPTISSRVIKQFIRYWGIYG